MTPLDNVRILEFPGVADPARGILNVIERVRFDRLLPSGQTEPYHFPIKRVFYIHAVPEGGVRGGHAHTSNCEVLICIAGAFTLTLTDSRREMTRRFDDPSHGIVIPPDVWTHMRDFAPGTILLVLCSEEYSEEGYIHNFNEFRRHIDTKYPS